MIPSSDDLIEIEDIVQPSRTYKLDLINGRIGAQSVDGLEAIRQAVFKILSTTRFEHLIYSEDYGNEADVGAVRGRTVFEAEIVRWVTEALLADDRISAVTGFSFNYELDSAMVSFTVQSEYGSYAEERRL